MTASSTTIGSVKYDASIDLASLSVSLKQADKLVEQSYQKQSKLAKKSISSANSNTSGTSASDAEARVSAIKKEAQSTLSALSSYAPKVQAQYLTLERANMRVTSATQRSAEMIQKYGVDSRQAQNASDSLTRALFSQSQAQQRVDQSTNKTTKSIGDMRIGSIAAAAVIASATAAIAVNIGNAVQRFDTLNNAPKVLQNMGNSAEESRGAIAALRDGIQGLPTSLDDAASALTRISAASGLGAKSSAALTLAFNNMALAGGKGPAEAERALVQFTQALGKGTIPAQEFNTLMDVMPAQMSQVAQSMLGVGKNAYDLRDAMTNGKVTVGEFSAEIIKLNETGGSSFASFSQQAKDATAGIGTGFTNMGAAITRGITSLIESIGGNNIQTALESIGKSFESVFGGIGYVLRATSVGFAPFTSAAGNAANSLSAFLGYISPLASLLAPVAGLLGGTALAFGAIAGSVFIATRAMQAFQFMLTVITKHPVIGALSLIAGLITAIATASGMGKLTDGMDKAADSSLDIGKAMKEASTNIGGASNNADKLAKQMAKIGEQTAKVRDDYRYSLAQLIQEKNENIATLRSTLSEEKKAYDNAFDERKTSFDKSQNDELMTHQQKTRALQNQIDFLTKYNTSANNKQLSELQFALARENEEYKKSTMIKVAEFNAETNSRLSEYEKRRQATELELSTDLALLNKHREEIASVRGIMLRDQIQNLQYQRDEQLKSLSQQARDAREQNLASGASAGAAFSNNFSSAINDSLNRMKATTERSVQDGDWLKRMQNNFQQNWDRNGGDFWRPMKDSFRNAWGLLTGSMEIVNGKIVFKPGGGGSISGRASGGPVSSGTPYLVGENRDGSVNKTTELFVPKTSGTIIPANELQRAMGGGSSQAATVSNRTINVTVNVPSGVFVANKSDKRQFANEIGKLINETVKAKTGSTAIAGI